MCGVQRRISIKNPGRKFLFVSIFFLMCFLFSSCAGRTLYRKSVSNFWQNENRVSVIVAFPGEMVNASNVPGRADMGASSADAAIETFKFGMIGALGTVIKGPERKRGDPEFERKIAEIVANTIQEEENYFFDHFLKKLTFSANVRPEFKISSMAKLRSDEREEDIKDADEYFVIELFIGFSGPKKSWSDDVFLVTTGYVWLIKDKETLIRFLRGECKLKDQSLFWAVEDDPTAQDEQPKLVRILMFPSWTKKYDKEDWLADNGQFFDKQLKFVLERLALEVNKKVFGIN